MEATPGIEIQGKRLCTSRSASNSQSVTQLELPGSRLSPAFPLSVHTVVPNALLSETVSEIPITRGINCGTIRR